MKDDGAVGTLAKINKIINNNPPIENSFAIINIIKGITISFKNDAKINSNFASFIEDKSKEKPIESNPIGRAEALIILKKFTAIIGKSMSK